MDVDILLYVLLVTVIVACMALRVYFRRRKVHPAGDESSQDEQASAEGEGVAGGRVGTGDRLHVKDAALMRATLDSDANGLAKGVETAVVSHVYKSFAGVEVVQDVSFDLVSGEVFGLVGPNGAGKTTTIRMLMDIIKPDFGEIMLFNQPIGEDTKDRIGYLPEERGLYHKMKVSDSLIYLARLKSMNAGLARERTDELLRQVDMFPHKTKRIGELSRGMGQIIQFLVTIAHDPDLIVLDEPFAGLDPVNRMLLKTIIVELKEQGKTVLLSTHMMNEVEEMCDRILMINEGRAVLYGILRDIKWQYRNNSVFVSTEGTIGELEGVITRKDHGNYVELFLDGETPPQRILSQLLEQNVRVDRFEVSTPSLNEIFLRVVKR